MLSSKKFTCKGTLRQVFIRVYRLVIQSQVGIFYPAVWTVVPLTFSLVSSPPLSLPCVNNYTIQCVRGGGGMESYRRWEGPQTDIHLSQVPLRVIIFRWRHLALVSIYLISPWGCPKWKHQIGTWTTEKGPKVIINWLCVFIGEGHLAIGVLLCTPYLLLAVHTLQLGLAQTYIHQGNISYPVSNTYCQ